MKALRQLALLALLAALLWAAWQWLGRTGWQPSEGVRGIAKRVFEPQPVPLGYPDKGPRPGEPIDLQLIEPPSPAYGPQPMEVADRKYASVARQAGANYDPSLGRAARELAAFYAQDGTLAPGGVMSFLLESAGAAAWGVRQTVVVTTESGDAPLLELAAKHVDAGTRIGMGEALMLGRGGRRAITLVSASRGLQLDAVSRDHRAGDTVRISGRLPDGWSAPHLLAMRPDLAFVELEVTGERRSGPQSPAGLGFVGSFEATEGIWIVELLGQGPLGPAPLAQLSFYVDEVVPDYYEGNWPPDEAHIERGRAAEAELLKLLQEDRRRFGLRPLEHDPSLDVVARMHSADMKRNNFVGHHSPSTGDVGDRLDNSGYRRVSHAENVALNHSVWDAESGLLRSLGHRRNILSRELSHVGVGAARKGKQWYLTQVFARPTPVLASPTRATRHVQALMASTREEKGLEPLRPWALLDRAAQAEAEAAEPSPKSGLGRASRAGLKTRASGWVAYLPTLDALKLPESVLDAGFRRMGVGIAQDLEREGATIKLVVLVAD